jgi:GTP-binding protein EngB required for normal cell division
VPPLDPATCVLLRDDRLVERFNSVNAILDEAARELPRFGERQVVADVRAQLAQLADTMTRERFAIGFIGPSQVGKSMTVSNLLSVAEADAPSPQGGSGPTTSVPTRLVPIPPSAGAANGITLRYFSTQEFRERIRDLCDLVKIQYDEDPRRLRDRVRAQQAENPHFKAADHVVLLGLLDAKIDFPDVVTDVGRVEEGDYAQRRVYATHQGASSKYTLLREVEIRFVTDAVSPEVEMVDLPGLGVDKESDARLTLAFLHQLDGAFMFQSGHQVKASAVSQLAEKMREQYARTLGERIWMVVTRCDDLNEVQLHGPADMVEQPAMFCHLSEAMRQQGIKAGNVIFVGNGYYQDRVAAGVADTAGVSEALRDRYPRVLRFDGDGRPVVPERCGRNPGQVEPWTRFVLDSGVPALRETMQTKVAEAVREQTRRDVSERLVAAIERLNATLLAAEQQSGMTIEEMLRASRWSGELDALADDIGRDPRYSRAAATAIETTLGEVIGTWGDPTRGGLAMNHANMAGMLVKAGLHEAAVQTDAISREVHDELERRSADEPPPQAVGLPTPLEFWKGVVEKHISLGQTADGGEFRGPILRGISDDPSPVADGGKDMTADDYLTVMRAKVARTARVFVSRLVREIQGHLHRLQGRYRALGTEVDHIDRDKRERYAFYRAALDSLRS